MASKKGSGVLLHHLSVTSKVVPAITSPPCTEHEEDDAEDYDDDNNASNLTHQSSVKFQNTFTIGIF